jgi:hypothetical protein
MCASLVHEGFTRFYSRSLIKLSITGWCLVNINIPALKTEYKIHRITWFFGLGVLNIIVRTLQNLEYLENGSNDFD